MRALIGIAALLCLSACDTGSPKEVNAAMTLPANPTPEEAAQLLEELRQSMPPEARAELEALEAKERARPRITNLTREVLEAFPDEYLDTSLIEHIGTRLRPDKYARAALLRLPRGMQVIYLSYTVEAEVMNGGLNQFFWNSSSEYAEWIEPALRELGAPAAADLFAKALVVATEDIPRITPFRRKGTLQAFSESYKDNPLNPLDEPFCKLSADFAALRLRYARQHADRFF